ncbi:NAD(P)-dependent oxidoreductase [Paenarthrobacter ureafaciens]|uniref:NAD(P)-dependent oxidoreductase n=1 Tax=Paenarthrobacter ureafaciens TaxID=37931 RepID=UPI0015C04E98|nr:NAD(P)-dependent oxidoreductase [Paenarthrobacter ureafaciens]NWL26609.1 NAD(P)-dependent oxidoreductase [Paenarthrobacter ureafaciens]
MTEVLGFVGLGNIGSRVVPHLLKAGHDVAVFDVNKEAVAALAEQGARPAESPAEAAKGASVIFLSLPTPQIVRTVVADEDGVLEGASQGAIIVDHSTIDPETARDLAAAASAGGFSYLDAPVSGGVQGADAGTLSVMIGGETDTVARVRPLVEAFAGNIFHVGPSGSGQVIKLANNVISAATILALGEGLSATVKAGVDLDTAVDVLTKSSAASFMLTSYFPRTLFTEERATSFALDFMLKDIKLFLESAVKANLPTPVSNIVGDIYRIGNRDGRGAKDFTSVVEFYEDFTGIRLQSKGTQS